MAKGGGYVIRIQTLYDTFRFNCIAEILSENSVLESSHLNGF